MRLRVLFFCIASAVLGCVLPSLGSPTSASIPEGGTLFKDDFSSPASGWARAQNAGGVMDYDGGGYHMLVNGLKTNLWSTLPMDFGNVRIEVDAGKLGGPDENRIGLICRSDGESYYFFIISSDGYYGLGLFAKGQAALLGQSQMQYSDTINTGAAINHLRADCNGDSLVFYVNGFQLAETRDSTLTHGEVGLLTGTFSQPGVDIVYDNFVVRKPQP